MGMVGHPSVEVVGLSGERFALAFEGAEAPQPGSHGPGDIFLRVSSVVGAFTCQVVTWVDRAAWNRFLSDLATLERERAGEASLESMSPGEVHVTLALPKGGRVVCLDWSVGTQCGRQTARFTASGVSVDVGLLAEFVSGARRIVPE